MPVGMTRYTRNILSKSFSFRKKSANSEGHISTNARWRAPDEIEGWNGFNSASKEGWFTPAGSAKQRFPMV